MVTFGAMTVSTTPCDACIHAAVAAIPRGSVATYGEIAARAGLPGRARRVGRALRNAPRTLALPWHRVVRADGRIAFAQGSDGFIEQCRRLQREGIEVIGGRVRIARSPRRVDLDRALWSPQDKGEDTR